MRTETKRAIEAGKSTGSRLLLVGLAVGVVGLTVVAIVLALQPTPDLDPATPEGAVQGYVRAVLDDDAALARSYFTRDLAGRCESTRFDHIQEGGTGIVIISTRARGDEVRVDVRITEPGDADPFGGPPYSFQETLVLEQHGDRWLITEPPWPIHYCPEASP